MTTSHHRTVLTVATSVLTLLASAVGAATVNVPADYPTIQEAIDNAATGDEIIVGPGVYVERLSYGRAIVLRSSDGPLATTIDGDRAGTVISMSHFGLGSRLEGFTITGGQTTSANRGSGLYAFNGAVEIVDCIFIDNHSLLDNSGGGAAGLVQVAATFRDCQFLDNGADGWNGYGGAIFARQSSDIVIVDSHFRRNHAHNQGAAILHESSNSRMAVYNSTFRDNRSNQGGVITCGWGADTTFVNCVLARNAAEAKGGALHAWTSGVIKAYNCTIVDNDGGGSGGGAMSEDGSIAVRNSIVWGNVASFYPQGFAAAFYNSDVEGGGTTNGNFNVDPQFVDRAGGHYQLASGSGCIDAGDPALLPADTADLDGDLDTSEPTPHDRWGLGRQSGGGLDCGAYERQPGPTVNDACLDATIVDLATSYDTMDTLVDATPDGSAECGNSNANGDEWFEVVVPEDGTLHARTCGTHDLGGEDAGMDTVLAVYAGCPASLANAIDCNDDAPTGSGDPCSEDSGLVRDAALAIPVVAGEVITIRVSRYGSSTPGAYALHLELEGLTCPGDVDGNGDVGFDDVLAILANWGPCTGCNEDADDDGMVGFSDVLAVLANWGSCG